MPIFRLGKDPTLFPNPALADPSGLLAVGGDLSPERLLTAYGNGIFPWYDDEQPILWWSPDPRMVLEPTALHVPRSLEKNLRRAHYQIRFDTAFSRVIRACAGKPRPGQSGTWITDDIVSAYENLHTLGFAHSAEAWLDGELVGGLYGVALGRAFFGESMYTDAPDASKAAFVVLVRTLARWGFPLIDCQMKTAHLERFGAHEIPRDEFLAQLRTLVAEPSRVGVWNVDDQ